MPPVKIFTPGRVAMAGLACVALVGEAVISLHRDPAIWTPTWTILFAAELLAGFVLVLVAGADDRALGRRSGVFVAAGAGSALVVVTMVAGLRYAPQAVQSWMDGMGSITAEQRTRLLKAVEIEVSESVISRSLIALLGVGLALALVLTRFDEKLMRVLGAGGPAGRLGVPEAQSTMGLDTDIETMNAAMKAVARRGRVKTALVGGGLAIAVFALGLVAKCSHESQEREKALNAQSNREFERERDKTRDPLHVADASGSWMANMSIAAVKNATGDEDIGGLRLESRDPSGKRIWNGRGSWKNRSLPAAIIEEEFSLANQEMGIRKRVCLVQAAIKDDEFNMWREHATMQCGSAGADAVQRWKDGLNFKPDPTP